MPAIKVTCKYELCTRGKDGGRKTWYGTKSAMYCCDKHGQYQRRLNKRRKESEDD